MPLTPACAHKSWPLLLSRRRFITGLCACGFGLTALSLSGCSMGGTGTPKIFQLSKDDEVRLGTEAWQQIKTKETVANNLTLKRMVGDVSTRIITAAGPDAAGLPWEYELFENPDPNAFALPGGKIGVNTGIFQVAQNEHQLATVLGHEIRHVTGHHGARRYEQEAMTSTGLQVASIALGGAGVQDPNKIISILGAGANVGLILPFSRDQESEADIVGLEYMAAAGYTPREALAFWQNMIAKAGSSGGPTFLSTHPSGDQRMATLEAKISEIEARPKA